MDADALTGTLDGRDDPTRPTIDGVLDSAPWRVGTRTTTRVVQFDDGPRRASQENHEVVVYNAGGFVIAADIVGPGQSNVIARLMAAAPRMWTLLSLAMDDDDTRAQYTAEQKERAVDLVMDLEGERAALRAALGLKSAVA